MASPKGFILYRIYYDLGIVYLGRTKQPLQSRLRGHMLAKPMHRAIDIHNVTRIEYTELPTEADMFLYEIYFINRWKPPLNRDDKAGDDLSISLPDLEWSVFTPANWERWKTDIRRYDAEYQMRQQDKVAYAELVREMRRKWHKGEITEDEYYRIKEIYSWEK